MKNIVKIIFVSALFVCIYQTNTFADVWENLYCKIDQSSIKISLQKSDWYKCSEYINTLLQIMKNTAKELYTIQEYIFKRQDVSYRNEVKKTKLEKLNKLKAMRLNILANIQTFQNNLLEKSLKYFLMQISPYKVKLEKTLSKLILITWDNASSPNLQKYVFLLSWQLDNIEQISKIKTVLEFGPLMTKYIYFKNQLEWKSE